MKVMQSALIALILAKIVDGTVQQERLLLRSKAEAEAAKRFAAASELGLGHAAGVGALSSGSSSVAKPRGGRRLQGEEAEAALFTAGRSEYGQFGGGWADDTEYLTPIEINLSVFDPNDIKQIAAGQYHTLVVLHDRTAWAAGWGSNGQLCSGKTENQATFAQIPLLTNVEKVAAGNLHSIIILSNGKVYGCGYNNEHQLGVTPNSDVLEPVEIPVVGVDGSPAHVVDAAAGWRHTLFLTQEGQCFSTGLNSYGQLCLGDTDDRTSATLITNLEYLTITQVAAGYSHTVLLDSNGTAHSCGWGLWGQLGNEIGTDEYDPYPITTLSLVEKVQCTLYSTVFLLPNSSLFSVGTNWYGEMGANLPIVQGSSSPTFQHVLDDVKDVFCGGSSFTCFVLQENDVLSAFGRNDYGQLGVGDNDDKNVPTLVNLTGIDLVAPGNQHTHFLRQEEPETLTTTTEGPTTTTTVEATVCPEQCPAGADGMDGAAGAVGPAGADGTDGETGATGPQGEVGATGSQGIQGPQGEVGFLNDTAYTDIVRRMEAAENKAILAENRAILAENKAECAAMVAELHTHGVLTATTTKSLVRDTLTVVAEVSIDRVKTTELGRTIPEVRACVDMIYGADTTLAFGNGS